MKKILATALIFALLWSVMATALADGIEVGEDAVIEAPEADETQLEIDTRDGADLILEADVPVDAELELADGLELAQTPVESGADGASGQEVQGNTVAWRGHHYRVIDVGDLESWDMAEAYCEYMGGYLAVITSAEEDAFIFNEVLRASGYDSAYFGLSDEEETGNWKWVNGTPVRYTNWASGEPNNQGGIEHYGMYYWKNGDGKWNDGDFSGSPAFICEWSHYTGQDSFLDFEIEDGVLKKYIGNSPVARIPKGVKAIGNEAFYGNNRLKEVVIPEGVKRIGADAFESCSALAKVSLPDSLAEIDDYAFWNCVALTDVKIPGGTKTIGKEAFAYCENLSAVSFSKGLTSIGEKAFYSAHITTLVLPDSVKRMGDYAFGGCKKLTSVILSDATTSLGKGAFDECVNLRDAILPDKLVSIGDSAFKNTSLTDVFFPDTLTEVGDFAYADCHDLKDVVIPESVQYIGDSAFEHSQPTIYCKPGSYADSYAEDADLPVRDIKEATPTRVTVTKGKRATAYVGEKLALKVKLEPARARTKLKWSSSKTKVATVSKKGVVTPKKAGKTVITVKTANGKKAKITVRVIDAESVKLREGKSATLKVGGKLTLHAKVAPARVVTRLTWRTDNKKVATVTEKGVVKALSPGKAVITVKTANGRKAMITVNVTE